ncbi:uncharacterized protein LOC110822427 [Carica papaya]|uniref:uncharacterized protein LOC110822427 n=1 Tax=Carica papaya TaxID=3649 RepID=UPI000B8D14C8|nr:uncharacterized protein LOC110822427 [Carica papaya]
MDFSINHSTPSPSSSSTSSSTLHPPTATTDATTPATTVATAGDHDPMHSWWESVSKQRSRILSLSCLLSSSIHPDNSLSPLADSDRPALSLLSSPDAYSLLSSALSAPRSGSGGDPLCQWLYETYLSSDPHLRLIVLSFLPLLSGIYLSRIHSSDSSSLPSLSGFEAVLLAIYASEAKARAGKPLVVQVPDLSQPSLYHTPRVAVPERSRPSVGVLSPPLEPQIAVKSTKRACIVGVALHCYFKQISQMPAWSKLEFCRFAAAWAGQDCPCSKELDGGGGGDGDEGNEGKSFENFAITNGNWHGHEIEDVSEEMGRLQIEREGEVENLENTGVRIPLPWELLQPILRILGHCLLGPLNTQDVKDAASMAVRRLYARASHDLVPQAILATRSLINLDKSARAAAKAAAAAANASSNANTPSKAKKPEILLVSK